MKISFFGSSLVSAYWNGAATYYRGLVRALSERGHRITFYEPDAYDRQAHRDIEDPDWAAVVVYEATERGVLGALARARSSNVVIKCSGVGIFDALLEKNVLDLATPSRSIGFCDVDAPATLERVLGDATDPFRALIPRYDFVFTYGGGESVCSRYRSLGARRCVPVYNALDPATHHASQPDERFAGTLGFLGNRLPDREARFEEFFLGPARALPNAQFVLGGSGWHDRSLLGNVRCVGHVYTHEHNAFNCTPLAVLNINRNSMADYGYSPATRVFEAAGAGACIITDAFEGVECFFEPNVEILVARDGEEVRSHLETLTEARARLIGQRALERVLREHTYARRAEELEALLFEHHGPMDTIRDGRVRSSASASAEGAS
ncbi:MAG: glycosyltransferase [Polyangiaceae bacterium]